MDTPSPSSSPSGAPSSAAEQARLRKERREAKIKAGGSARLGKITSMGGRPPEANPQVSASPAAQMPLTSESPSSSTPFNPTSPGKSDTGGEDPAEVDISQHFYTPDSAAGQRWPRGQPVTQDQLRQMMLNFDAGQSSPPGAGADFFPGGGGIDSGPDQQGQDPMARLLQQFMGGAAGGSNGADGGLPPALAQLMGQGAGPGQDLPRDKYGYLWRIIHVLSALALGVYAVLTTSFTGSNAERITTSTKAERGPQFFWMFATVELLLQSTRFFLERGRAPGGGILVTVAEFLPEPWKGYVKIGIRYSAIFTTIIADAMVIIFALGCVAWWRGT